MANLNKIDESLYSRQLYVLGHEAMKNMSNASILLSGLGGLGAEIAKNLILSGVKKVVLHDTKLCTWKDLSSNFYLDESCLGKNRALVSASKFAELNGYVDVSASNMNLTNKFLKQFNVVILTDNLLSEALKINKFTHKNNIKFLFCSTHGLVIQLFNDFCEHTVNDIDGEQLISVLVDKEKVNKNEKIIASFDEHGLQSGKFIRFDDKLDAYEIQYVDKHKFKIDKELIDIPSAIHEIKVPVTLNFKSLIESLQDPEFLIINYLNFDRHTNLHACFMALNELDEKRIKYTKEVFTEYVKKHNSDATDKDISKFYHCIDGDISPIQAIAGGIVAQEAIKSCSSKYNPIKQWFYFDAFECLPENYENISKDMKGTRHDYQIKVFGNELQEKFNKLRYFVVGSGAIGCELLKNMAMMGVGNITVTDMDTIEKSNLSRQFLFRNHDIGKSKSVSAKNAILKINPNINIIAHENKVCPETENIYNKNFFNNIDGVANALDNVEARRFVDNLCLYYKKSLMESGTLGTKGNTQIVVPHLTETYGSTPDAPEREIPSCTLKHFPYKVEHTIQWGKDTFFGEFMNAPTNTLKYLNDPTFIKLLEPNQVPEMCESIIDALKFIPKTFDDCVVLGLDSWNKHFRDSIKKLLEQFPLDAKAQDETPFWTGTKKPPTEFEFDINNEHHTSYIHATAHIYATMYNIKNDSQKIDKTIKILSRSNLPKIDNKKVLDEELINYLPDPKYFKGLKLTPIEFEKDDDSNFHIDYITASSNMRNLNYGIELTNKYDAKGIAGKIIPAIATTTSVVSGLTLLELYKLINGCDNLEIYKNNFLNLAIPYIGSADPIGVKKFTYKNNNFSMWSSFDVDIKNPTVKEIIEFMKNKYEIEVSSLCYNTTAIYYPLLYKEKAMARLNMNVKDILASIANTYPEMKDIFQKFCEVNFSGTITLTMGVDDDDEDDIQFPQIKFDI